MGIGKLIEEVGGAIAAEQAAEALDPNAGILVKGAAAVAGFMGASTLSNALEAHTEAQRHPAPAAALDAYHLNGLDKVGSTNWTWTLICYYAELFNGFGYRDYHRMRSPYLWGGTNLQQLGKYTSDGKFDAGHFDSQPGVIPLAMRMAQLDQSLAMTDPWPFAIGPAVPIPAAVPVQTPIASFDVFKVQRDLKKKGFDPGLVDGSFGRKTSVAVRAFEAANGLVADGLLDAKTVTALAA